MNPDRPKRLITLVQLNDEVAVKLSTKPGDVKKAAKRIMDMINYRSKRIKLGECSQFDRMGLEAWAMITIMNAAFPDTEEDEVKLVEYPPVTQTLSDQ